MLSKKFPKPSASKLQRTTDKMHKSTKITLWDAANSSWQISEYESKPLQVGVVLIWERHIGGALHLLGVLVEENLIDLSGWWSKSWSSNEFLFYG
jgi:hypothetical protein